MKVPFVDLRRDFSDCEAAVRAAVDRVFSRQEFILGEEVASFESAFSRYLGVEHVLGCGNGTDALTLLLRAAGVGPGDEVITVSHTFFATAESIVATGAHPVFADIRPSDGLMDPDCIEPLITNRTKAVVPVHLYGRPVAMSRILAVARKFGIYCFEDAAQAHGAVYNGKKAGSLADGASFSFYPSKNLGACGDAGAVATCHGKLSEAVRMLRDHGRIGKYEHLRFSGNMRMDAIQSAVLREKIPHLDRWVEGRRRMAAIYDRFFSHSKSVRLLSDDGDAVGSYHLYVIRITPAALKRFSGGREELRERLKAEGVESGVHYPIPCHLQPAWKARFPAVELPETEAFASQCLSLPIFGTMSDSEAEHAARAVLRVFGEE